MKALADVAREAKDETWMKRSYSESSSGGRFPLTTSRGYCCAWAAECLAHAFEPERGPNRRHAQRHFTYVYGTAHSWGRALRAGGDCDVGEWIEWAGQATGPSIRPGDMMFWIKGVNGYKYGGGHVAIVVGTGEGTCPTVSENSSVRGIGTHAISQSALNTMAGIMRWHVGEEPRPLLVQMADSTEHCEMWMKGSTAVCGVRALAEMLGYEVHAEHLGKDGKVYVVGPVRGPAGP